MDGLEWKTLLKFMIWGPTPIFGNTHIYTNPMDGKRKISTEEK